MARTGSWSHRVTATALADALDNALSVAVEPSGDRIRAVARQTAASHDLGVAVAVSLDRYAEWVR